MKGLIFIPDISGFTNFVNSINLKLGVAITRDLLNEIIDNNPLDIQLSEIEGDAVLFYKLGKPIDLQTLLEAFDGMSKAFEKKYALWKEKYNIEPKLSLKLIVHYGNMIVYNIRGFKKIYGETVIESHRLLKNGSRLGNYVLITDNYLDALNDRNYESTLSEGNYCSYSSHLQADAKLINYSYFSKVMEKTFSANSDATKEVFAA